MKLYELTKEMREAVDMLSKIDDEQLTADTMEGLKYVWEAKAEAVAITIAETEAKAEAIRTIARRQSERAKTFESRATWLRKYLADNLQAVGKNGLSTPHISLKLISGRESVSVIDESGLPDELVRVERRPDKNAIKEAIEDGRDLSGCAEIVTGPKSITIK